ncbi:unnamed protein product [Vicia faba]|uniref:Uncharacterized protein n=1 Tax=Vicia faba TaxID=3906 RepID=A0AAV1AKJ4_VICFA|nr:unnamed protein product [Vicia faba]
MAVTKLQNTCYTMSEFRETFKKENPNNKFVIVLQSFVEDLAEESLQNDSLSKDDFKSMIRHCVGGGGGLEAITTIKAITSGWFHPTINQDFVAKICLLTSFRDACFIEIMPLYQTPQWEVWLSFWFEVHYNSLYENRVSNTTNHGRRGSIGRGRGLTYMAIQSQPPDSMMADYASLALIISQA